LPGVNTNIFIVQPFPVLTWILGKFFIYSYNLGGAVLKAGNLIPFFQVFIPFAATLEPVLLY
jgi:hypothetical protein